MPKTFDAIVLGTGGVGSAALLHLARRGLRVLGLDRFAGGHDRGSSHGQSRIIRKAYFEHPDYVPLLERAYSLWHELQQRQQEKLFYQVGLVEIGPAAGVVLPGVRESARQHRLLLDEISASEFAARFPGFVLPPGSEAVYEQDAGFLLVERCVLAHLSQAERHGARLRSEAAVQWHCSSQGVTVQTAKEQYQAARLVIAAGAWSSQVLAELGVPLRVLRKHLHWYQCEDPGYRADQGCPAFFYETAADSFFYGFPAIDPLGVKVAEHSGGAVVADPLHDSRLPEPEDRRRVEAFLQRHLPGVSRRSTAHTVCYYTMSPDEHFLLDRHPRFPQVVLAAGLSGHGFKFTSVLGQALADLAVDGDTQLPIDFLRLRRFAPA